MTTKLEGNEEQLQCIECSGTKNVILCSFCRDSVCKGCMFNHNENEREAELQN